MALVVKDRVRETSTSTGTANVILSGSVQAFQSFSVIGDGNTTYYAIVDATTGDWEVGIGTYTLATTTLTRNTILESSDGGTAVNFAANVKDVFVTYPAERAVYGDATNVVTGYTITGGSINNTPIGATTPTTGAFTTLSASSTVSGAGFSTYLSSPPAIGNTAPNTGAFTTLSSTGNTTLGDATADTVTINGTPTINAPTVITTNSTTNALRITQTGTGNALLVEDSANPDASPFVIDQNGRTVIGALAPYASFADTGGTNRNPFFQMFGATVDPASAAIVNTQLSGTPAIFTLAKSRSTSSTTRTIVNNADPLGSLQFSGDDGTRFITGASITANVDGTPGTNDMPGRLVFSTTADGASSPTERMRINNRGEVGIGAASGTGLNLLVAKNITGATSAVGVSVSAQAQSDVTTRVSAYQTAISTQASTYTLANLQHFRAAQGTFGAGSTVTNQFGFEAGSSLTGATNNYGFYGNIAIGTGRWNFYAAGTAANLFAGETTFGSNVLMIGTGAVKIPVGTTAQRPSPVAGMLRFNDDSDEFEGYNGTAWASVGGSAISNDTTTATDLFPSFLNATTGTAASIFTSNAKLLYKPSTGEFKAQELVATNGIVVNSATISADYTIPTGSNAMSAGPVTVSDGITVTVSDGSFWVVV